MLMRGTYDGVLMPLRTTPPLLVTCTMFGLTMRPDECSTLGSSREYMRGPPPTALLLLRMLFPAGLLACCSVNPLTTIGACMGCSGGELRADGAKDAGKLDTM
jgi:hypothetical protein